MASAFTEARQFAKLVPDGVKVVLLGECTHGTEEFYQLRADVTRYLIHQRKFSVVVVEADWPFMFHVNQYIQRKKRNVFPNAKDGGRFPQWMWKNKPFVDLVQWMRRKGDCSVFGMDCYCKEESMTAVCKILERRGDAASKHMAARIRAANAEEWPVLLSQIQWAKQREGEAAAAASSSSAAAAAGGSSGDGGGQCVGCLKVIFV